MEILDTANGGHRANVKGTNGAAHVKDTFAYGDYTSNLYGVATINGATVADLSAAPAITAANIPRIETTVPAATRIILTSSTNQKATTADHTCVGWLIGLNQGGQDDARTAFISALDTNFGDLMGYGVTMEAAAALSNVIFMGANDRLIIDLTTALTDIFFLDVHTATTAVGSCYLGVNLGVPA